MPAWIEPWLQFGLGGTVIGALFYSLRFFILQARQEREQTAKNYREERTDWKESVVRIADRSDRTAREISQRFADLHEKTLDALRDREQ